METLPADWEAAKKTVARIIDTVPKLGSGPITGLYDEKDSSELSIRLQYELLRVSDHPLQPSMTTADTDIPTQEIVDNQKRE